jgi:hypothetical protein
MMRAPRLVKSPSLVLLALLLGLASCQTIGEITQEFDPRARPEVLAYGQAIKPYLAQGAVYDGPATELLAKALPLTPAVRRAMVARRAAAFDLDQAARAKEAADQTAALNRGLEVMLSVFMPDTRWNDLTSSRPAWRVFLKMPDQRQLRPVDARLVKKRSAINQALYPFWGPWDRLYRLRFDLKPADGRYGPKTGVKLVLAGPPGQAEIPLLLD